MIWLNEYVYLIIRNCVYLFTGSICIEEEQIDTLIMK